MASDTAVTNALICPLCGGADVETYCEGDDQKLSPADLGSSRKKISHGKIARCHACRFGFRTYRPAEEEISNLYRELDATVYEKEAQGRAKTANRHLRIVHRYIQTGRLLDVGCASGAFLNCAREAGWNVAGVEPSQVLCGKARELLNGRGEVLCAPLQQTDFPPASFDALTLWDVLEHVPDPLAFMTHCVSLIKPGGYFFANVPNLDSLQARLLGPRWPLLLAEHLNYFDRNSLKRCGEMAQLQLVRFGRRPASFSLEYVLFRLEQHRIPGASLGYATVRQTFLNHISIPVFLGEAYGVWMRPLL